MRNLQTQTLRFLFDTPLVNYFTIDQPDRKGRKVRARKKIRAQGGHSKAIEADILSKGRQKNLVMAMVIVEAAEIPALTLCVCVCVFLNRAM